MRKPVVLLLIMSIFSLFNSTSCEKYDAPESSFTCDKTSGTIPLTVNFTSTSQGQIDSYHWEFGDGGTSTSPNVQHTYTISGSYTVRLTVKGPGGEGISDKTITVSEAAPVAGFTCDKTSGDLPLTVSFTSTSSGNITSYSWNFGDGGTSSSANPTHTYNDAGTFSAELTVNGPGGSNSASKTITVTDPGTNLRFYNKTYTDITITINSITKTIAVDGYVDYTGVQGSSFSYYAYTYGKTDVEGEQIGLKVEWNHTHTISGGTQSYNLNVSSSIFFIKMKNQSTHTLQNLYVNYGLVSQTVDYIYITNTGTTDPLGYYKAYTNSNVRIYWQDNNSYYYYWDQGTHFTLPWTENQSVTLSTPSTKSARADGYEGSGLGVPGMSELQEPRNDIKSDPDAIDVFNN